MSWKYKFILWVLFISWLTPIVAYGYKFGFGIWGNPSEWSDLGSYIGGIYTPILSFITLAMISTQIFIQNQQHQHSLIQHQEEQIKEYIFGIDAALERQFEDRSVRDFLVDILSHIEDKDINSIPADLVFEFNQMNHRVYSMWCEVIKCLLVLDGLSSGSLHNRIAFHSNKNKVIAYLNPQTCRMLDRFHYVFSIKCRDLGIPVETVTCKYYYSDLRIGL